MLEIILLIIILISVIICTNNDDSTNSNSNAQQTLCLYNRWAPPLSNTMLEIIANSLSHSMSLETLSLKEKVSVHIIRVWGPQLNTVIEGYIGFDGLWKGGWHISKGHSQSCILRSCQTYFLRPTSWATDANGLVEWCELSAVPLDDDCQNSLSKASKGWGRARTEWVSWLTRGWLEVWLQIGESWMKTPVTSSDGGRWTRQVCTYNSI